MCGGLAARMLRFRRAPSSILVRMHPIIGRDLPLFRELDHVHGA
jgi:hypothetical protein